MKTKQEIVENWLPRYTQMPLESFGTYILLTNFNNYVDIFCDNFGIEKPAYTSNMRCATADGITIINFGMGSPNAAIIMDLLSAIKPKACLFLGKCGGISSKTQRGDLVLPIAGIRGEGTSNDYFPPEVPALPAFMLQRAVSSTIRDLGSTTGQARSIPPTDASGNTTKSSKNISALRGQWLSIWRRQRFSHVASPIIYRRERSSSSVITL